MYLEIDGRSCPGAWSNSGLFYRMSRCLPQQFKTSAHPCPLCLLPCTKLRPHPPAPLQLRPYQTKGNQTKQVLIRRHHGSLRGPALRPQRPCMPLGRGVAVVRRISCTVFRARCAQGTCHTRGKRDLQDASAGSHSPCRGRCRASGCLAKPPAIHPQHETPSIAQKASVLRATPSTSRTIDFVLTPPHTQASCALGPYAIPTVAASNTVWGHTSGNTRLCK